MSYQVLGISAFYHDSAAALVRDGEIVAAAQEERFTRKKHDPAFPERAVNYCLEEGFIDPSDLDAVVFYDRPLLTYDRALKNALQMGDAGRDQFLRSTRSLLGQKVHVEDIVRRCLGSLGRANELLLCEHHVAHAASAFFPSPFEESAILTIDGVGEWAALTVGRGDASGIEILREIDYPHSLGLLYSAATHHCGFKVNSGEYKLMGLAPYGEPRFVQEIRENLIDLKDDGSFRLNTDYFGFLTGDAMTNTRFEELFGTRRRPPHEPISRHQMDVAASFQVVIEEAVLAVARFAKAETGSRHLVLAGGVALNCVANGRLLRAGVFADLWIQPAAGDAGGALGAALQASHINDGARPRPARPGGDGQLGSYLGPAFSDREIRAFLDRRALPFEHIPELDERSERIARTLAEGKVVGFFSGRMEFGPRALGARSILGDPRRADTQSKMNLQIKFRESFRPFAPSVLEEEAGDHFELDRASPYMLLVADVRKEHRLPRDRSKWRSEGEDMMPIINEIRSHLPAITHVDFSARVQTVRGDTNPAFHRLLEAFGEQTGVGVVVNTSFNVRGEPIVCTPADAFRCFMRTEIDLLVLEDYLLWKDAQSPSDEDEAWKARLIADDEGESAVRAPSGSGPVPVFGDPAIAVEAGRIWREELAGAVGGRYFAARPDAGLPTYYLSREGAGVEGLRTARLGSANAIEEALLELWSDARDEGLRAAAPALAALAMRLKSLDTQDGELPEFVYTLF